MNMMRYLAVYAEGAILSVLRYVMSLQFHFNFIRVHSDFLLFAYDTFHKKGKIHTDIIYWYQTM